MIDHYLMKNNEEQWKFIRTKSLFNEYSLNNDIWLIIVQWKIMIYNGNSLWIVDYSMIFS